MTRNLLVACADIGSVAGGNFGWWTSDGNSGAKPSSLAEIVAAALDGHRPVALGFECPLFVPLADDEMQLTKARPGEGSRAWSAGAGCGALATGLVEIAWVLRAIKASLHSTSEAYVDWASFIGANSGLFLWEALVTSESKSPTHVGDARVAVETFLRALPHPAAANAISCKTPVISLLGAALVRTGWSNSPALLDVPVLVIRAGAAVQGQ
jgi:hypothetical protein